MNRKGLTAVICIISVAVFAALTFLFIDVMFKPHDVMPQPADTDTKPSDTDTQPTGTDTQPTGTDTQPTGTDTQPTGTDTNPGQDTKPPTGGQAEPKPDNTVSHAGIPESYKKFKLTAGMSAKEAYDYITEFLDSKYSILVNKNNKVNSDYEPSNLTTPSGSEYKLEAKAAAALNQMLSDAKKDGIYDLQLYSGYRTYASQKNKYETRIKKYLNEGYSQKNAEAKAGEYIAPPGSSEHHTGLAADVCSYALVSKYGYLSDSFDTTDEWKWLNKHCSEYGFILRYKKEAEDITGFLYEPWHFRYIGTEHAKACTELGITYEEYYEMLVKFKNEAKSEA